MGPILVPMQLSNQNLNLSVECETTFLHFNAFLLQVNSCSHFVFGPFVCFSVCDHKLLVGMTTNLELRYNWGRDLDLEVKRS